MDDIQTSVGQLKMLVGKHGRAGALKWWHLTMQQRTLRKMLTHSRFDFLSTATLMNKIGADRTTTEQLLLMIGAKRSEVSDEWAVRPTPTNRDSYGQVDISERF